MFDYRFLMRASWLTRVFGWLWETSLASTFRSINALTLRFGSLHGVSCFNFRSDVPLTLCHCVHRVMESYDTALIIRGATSGLSSALWQWHHLVER